MAFYCCNVIRYVTIGMAIDINNKNTAMSVKEEMVGFPEMPFLTNFLPKILPFNSWICPSL